MGRSEHQYSAVETWLHRRGVVRLHSRGHGPFGWLDTVVETAVPWEWLARRTARAPEHAEVTMTRLGLLRRRWVFQPRRGRHRG